jgi:hypothetical protein
MTLTTWLDVFSTLRLGGTATSSPPYAFMAYTGTNFIGYEWWREQVRFSDKFYSALLSLSVSQYTSLPSWKLSFRNLMFSCSFLLNQNNFLGPVKVTPYVIVALTQLLRRSEFLCCFRSFSIRGFLYSVLLPVS